MAARKGLTGPEGYVGAAVVCASPYRRFYCPRRFGGRGKGVSLLNVVAAAYSAWNGTERIVHDERWKVCGLARRARRARSRGMCSRVGRG